MTLEACPIELKDANAYVESLHRHHAPVHRDKFRFGCVDSDGDLHGVIQLARPVARMLDDGKTIEVVRCCTDGTKNACSFLYSRAARIAKEMGYKHIITYILQEESGVTLRAAGWELENFDCGGGAWGRPGRPRGAIKYPTGKKQRWGKTLKKVKRNE